MSRRDFVSIPQLPDTGSAEMNKALNAMKENIELLCGQRGAPINHAVLKGDIETGYPSEITDVTVAQVDGLRDKLRSLLAALKAA